MTSNQFLAKQLAQTGFHNIYLLMAIYILASVKMVRSTTVFTLQLANESTLILTPNNFTCKRERAALWWVNSFRQTLTHFTSTTTTIVSIFLIEFYKSVLGPLRTQLNEKSEREGRSASIILDRYCFAFSRCDYGIWRWIGLLDCSSISFSSSTESELHKDPASLLNFVVVVQCKAALCRIYLRLVMVRYGLAKVLRGVKAL